MGFKMNLKRFLENSIKCVLGLLVVDRRLARSTDVHTYTSPSAVDRLAQAHSQFWVWSTGRSNSNPICQKIDCWLVDRQAILSHNGQFLTAYINVSVGQFLDKILEKYLRAYFLIYNRVFSTSFSLTFISNREFIKSDSLEFSKTFS